MFSKRIGSAFGALLLLVSSVTIASSKYGPTSGGGGGAVTTSSPVSGNGSSGTPITIAAGALNLNILANINTATLLGNNAGISGPPLALTASQAWGVLGVQPCANFPALTGAVTTTSGGCATTYASIANGTILGNNSGSTAAPSAIAFVPPRDFVTTLGTAAQDITVTGLAGDTDGDYAIDFVLSTSSPGQISFQPNGTAANQKAQQLFFSSTVGAQAQTLLGINNGPTNGIESGTIYFTSKSGRVRHFQMICNDLPDN